MIFPVLVTMCEKGFLCMSVFYHSGLLFWMSFCCMILLKKKNRMEGGREGGRVYGGKFGIRGFTNSTFFPASSYLVFLRFCFICTSLRTFFFFFSKCSCITVTRWHRFCLSVFVYLDCVGGIYRAHISLWRKRKKKINNNRMYRVLYPGNLVLLSAIHIMRL